VSTTTTTTTTTTTCLLRESLPDLLRELGFAVEGYGSAGEYLNFGRVDTTSCLPLDIAMPGTTGPEFAEELLRRGKSVPVIFTTARPMRASGCCRSSKERSN
jgi:FixJ family two-component response regulator